MSGTSLDGLDLALCTFEKKDSWSFRIEKAETIDFDPDLEMVLRSAHELDGLALTRLDRQFAHFTAEAVDGFLQGLKQEELPELIVSHGQTVFHSPDEGFTLQIGSPAVIAALTGIPTLGDLRSTDMALGGQGAPLVPVGDALLFGDYRASLNLGGFANVSVAQDGRRTAWDVCPGNYVLNALSRERGYPFDKDGALARKGEVSAKLLRKLEALDYYKKAGPKSLGREWAEAQVMPLLDVELAPEDKLATFTLHVAKRLAWALRTVKGPTLVTGGGARNSYLIELLEKEGVELKVPDMQLIDYKEALIFGFLGVLYLRDEPNIWAEVTGASRDSVAGVLAK